MGLQWAVSGLALGVLHALTGPNHLSALITISVGQGWPGFWLGIRWGLGHSTGLIIVTGALIALREAWDEVEMLGAVTGWTKQNAQEEEAAATGRVQEEAAAKKKAEEE